MRTAPNGKRGNRPEVAQTMGWERGYYYRVRKVNGRVVREYIGAGKVAELVARMDALEREQRQLEALERRHEKEQLNTLDAELKTLNDKVDLAARAALLAAGFYRHKRGEWRRRRDQDDSHSADRPEEA